MPSDSRKAFWRIMVVGATVLAVAVLGAWGFSYTHSPEYALARLGAAVRDHDSLEVRRRLDSRAIGEQVATALIRNAMRKSGEELANGHGGSGFAALGTALGAKLLEGLQPMMADRITDMLDSATLGTSVVRHDRSAHPASSVEELRKGADTLPGIVAALRSHGRRIGQIGSVLQFGDSAVVSIGIREGDVDTTLTAEVAMKRVAGTWRVVGLPNVAKYLDRLDQVQELRLKKVNEPIVERMNQLVALGSLSVSYEKGSWVSDYLHLWVPVTNRSSTPIRSVWLRVRGPSMDDTDLNGLLLTSLSEDPPPIAPGATVSAKSTFEYNQFMELHRLLRFSPESYSVERYLIVAGSKAQPDTVRPYPSWSSYRAAHPYQPPSDDAD